VTDRANSGAASEPTTRLRLLATTDLHVHLLPFDYYTDRPQPATGLAQAATLIRALRAEAGPESTLLLDNGDMLSGSLLSDLLAARSRLLAPSARGGDGLHPMIAAMNAVGYDAGALGNHEFDHDLRFLRTALAEAAFPIVSANIALAEGSPLARPWTIIERHLPGANGARHPIRVGVIGLAPPQIAAWTAASLDGAVRTRDILDAAQEEIPRLRAAGADLVVALCHSGIGPGAPEPGLENAALPLAALPGLDALVAGHTHEVFPDASGVPLPGRGPGVDARAGTLYGTPAVQPGFFGSHVGVIDLDLRREARGWEVTGHRVRALPVPPDTPSDPRVSAAVGPAHRRLLAVTRRPVGTTRVPLHSYFSLVGPDATLDVVADAKRAEARRLLGDRPEAGLPILCSVSPFKSGGRGGPENYIDIPPGPLAFRQAADLYVYPNTFCLVEITGQGLRDWLERSAALFHTLAPGVEDQPLLDPDAPSYNFDTIDGLTWALDLARGPRTDAWGRLIDPSASRVQDLRQGGRPVADDDRFVLATSSYRMATGGSFAAAGEARVILQSPTFIRDLVLAHVRAAPVEPAPRPGWRMVSLPGTSAWFDSGPGAARHLGHAASRSLEPLGETPEGFWRFRLRL
jgi:2',3'-cyclic-nucleotide 2'-phosphodiesterase/3'-nucleotidase